MKIGQNLRKIRMNHTKFSQQNMADELGVDRNTYANWEKGENDIKSEYIPKLAEILGVEIQELFKTNKESLHIVNINHEGKDNSILNGAIIILNDKESIEGLINYLKGNH